MDNATIMNSEKKFYPKKRWIVIFLLVLFFATIYLLRTSILISIGYFLVADDPDYSAPVYAVLGGNSAERGKAAAGLAIEYPQSTFIVTGGNQPSQLAAVGIITTEADLTQQCMKKLGVDDNRIKKIEAGTSSKEEATLLLDYCKKNKIQQITIVSGQYHLRRLRRTFEPPFRESQINIKFFGAFEKDFNPLCWWKSESGLIYTNNEYIKILYYWMKY
jgi:uncharacterized SAM-binding protein YcdF (DUF218 family)